MYELKMNMIQTIGLAVIILIIGRSLRKKIKFFENYCIPSPVIGGFLFAIINLFLYKFQIVNITFDTTLQSFFMTIFFTSVGFNASARLLKLGGIKVILFLISAVGLLILQNVVAIGLGNLLGIHPLLALLTGSTPMTGGHGTAAAISPIVEGLGHSGAQTIAIAAATFGLIAGSSLGGPLADIIIRRKKIAIESADVEGITARNDELLFSKITKELDGEKFTKAFFMILLAMFLGTYVSMFLGKFMTFPSYIGAMLVAAVIRNISDYTTKFNINYEEVRILEDVSLNLFLGMAMISLKLWQLSDVAGPLIILLLAQAILAVVYIYFVTYNVMGRNYDATVLSAGHVGFGLGATPNGIANMQSVSSKYTHSNVAFFVMPLVGALFIDFFNVPIITLFISWLS